VSIDEMTIEYVISVLLGRHKWYPEGGKVGFAYWLVGWAPVDGISFPPNWEHQKHVTGHDNLIKEYKQANPDWQEERHPEINEMLEKDRREAGAEVEAAKAEAEAAKAEAKAGPKRAVGSRGQKQQAAASSKPAESEESAATKPAESEPATSRRIRSQQRRS
jgi:hypothetical protein